MPNGEEYNSVKKTGCILLLLFLLFPRMPLAYAETDMIDRILATVNGEIITLSEFERYKTMMYFGASEKPEGREADRQLLGSLIERKLLLQEGKKLEIEVRDREVDMALEDVMKRNNISLKTLKEELTKQDLTLRDYRDLLRNEIMQSQIIGRQVHAKITITDKDIQEYYNQSVGAQEKKGPRVRIQQILLLLPQDSNQKKAAELERNAADIREKILAGEDFEKLAAAYSQGAGAQTGGDLGFFHKGELLPEIEQAAFSLEKGEISPVIKTSLGFHIIRVVDRDLTGDSQSWQDQAREIKGMLYNIEFEKLLQEYINDLKEKAYIEIN